MLKLAKEAVEKLKGRKRKKEEMEDGIKNGQGATDAKPHPRDVPLGTGLADRAKEALEKRERDRQRMMEELGLEEKKKKR